MRHLVILAALVGLTQAMPAAYAQSYNSARDGQYVRAPDGTPDAVAGPANPANCGTPDEPKACPPMPRHNLTYYPGDRPWKQ